MWRSRACTDRPIHFEGAMCCRCVVAFKRERMGLIFDGTYSTFQQ